MIINNNYQLSYNIDYKLITNSNNEETYIMMFIDHTII